MVKLGLIWLRLMSAHVHCRVKFLSALVCALLPVWTKVRLKVFGRIWIQLFNTRMIQIFMKEFV